MAGNGVNFTSGTAPAKGNLLAHDGTNFNQRTVGSNNQVLTVDSAETTGIKWTDAGGGAVRS